MKANESSNQAEVVATAETTDLQLYDLNKPQMLLNLGKQLTRFVNENKLTTKIQGRDYVNVEGWQFLYGCTGLDVITTSLINLSTAEEIRYQANAELRTMDGRLVGSGFALCSNKEAGKKFWGEYAIASMAQTRAIGKAGRNKFAYILRAAGFEPTPAEEMDFQTPETTNTQPTQVVYDQEEVEIKTATAKQEAEIIKLLNHPTITMDEKNKMLLNINRFDEDRASQAIGKLKKSIEDRTAKVNVAGK